MDLKNSSFGAGATEFKNSALEREREPVTIPTSRFNYFGCDPPGVHKFLRVPRVLRLVRRPKVPKTLWGSSACPASQNSLGFLGFLGWPGEPVVPDALRAIAMIC